MGWTLNFNQILSQFSFPKNKAFRNSNCDYDGDIIDDFRDIFDADTCQRACAFSTNCVYFIYDLTTHDCTLLDSRVMTCDEMYGTPSPDLSQCQIPTCKDSDCPHGNDNHSSALRLVFNNHLLLILALLWCLSIFCLFLLILTIYVYKSDLYIWKAFFLLILISLRVIHYNSRELWFVYWIQCRKNGTISTWKFHRHDSSVLIKLLPKCNGIIAVTITRFPGNLHFRRKVRRFEGFRAIFVHKKIGFLKN